VGELVGKNVGSGGIGRALVVVVVVVVVVSSSSSSSSSTRGHSSSSSSSSSTYSSAVLLVPAPLGPSAAEKAIQPAPLVVSRCTGSSGTTAPGTLLPSLYTQLMLASGLTPYCATHVPASVPLLMVR